MTEKPEGYPETPELDKALKIKDKSETISEFIEWCHDNKICLARSRIDRYQEIEHVSMTESEIARTIAMSFGIDYDAMNREQNSVLKNVGEHQ